MSKKPAFARICITLPREVLTAADKLAARLDRSRSWVIAEAVRQYAERSPTSGGAGTAVRESVSAPYRPGLGEQRLAQLEADLALTAEQRVRAAEETADLARLARPRPPVDRLLFFDKYEDFLTWKKYDAAGGA